MKKQGFLLCLIEWENGSYKAPFIQMFSFNFHFILKSNAPSSPPPALSDTGAAVLRAGL